MTGYGDPDESPTVTPAPVPTDDPEATPDPPRERADPGNVSDNPSHLVANHESVLDAAGSYTRTLELRVLYDNGSVVERACETALVNHTTDRYLIIGSPWLASSPFSDLVFGPPTASAATRSEPVAFERYKSTWNEFYRLRLANGSTNHAQTQGTTMPSQPQYAALLERTTLEVERGIHERSPWWTSLAGRIDNPPAFRELRSPEPGQLRVVVRGEGLIEQIALIYNGNWTGHSATIVLDITYSGIGATTVGTPKWVEPEAIQNPSMKTYIPRTGVPLTVPNATTGNASVRANPPSDQSPACKVLEGRNR